MLGNTSSRLITRATLSSSHEELTTSFDITVIKVLENLALYEYSLPSLIFLLSEIC